MGIIIGVMACAYIPLSWGRCLSGDMGLTSCSDANAKWCHDETKEDFFCKFSACTFYFVYIKLPYKMAM